MILKTLYDYYEKHTDILPPVGKEFVGIHFVICIDSEGRFVRFEDLRNEEKDAGTPLEFERGVLRTSGQVANFLYDKSAYVLGIDDKSTNIPDTKSNKYLSCFKELVERVYSLAKENKHASALHLFYNDMWDGNCQKMQQDNLWAEIEQSVSNKTQQVIFTFSCNGEYPAQDEELISIYRSECLVHGPEGRCLVAGRMEPIVKNTWPTPIPGSQATAKLISFQVGQGYDSYGKEQGANAPIGETAEFAFTTALRHLLAKDSYHRFLLSGKTYVYWISSVAEEESDFNQALSIFCGTSKDHPEDSLAKVEQMRSLMKSIYNGERPTTSEDRFYLLGLKPNVARIAASYWADIPLKEFSKNIIQHFDDTTIDCSHKKISKLIGLYDILRCASRDKDISKSIPHVSDGLLKSIFEGTPYPLTLLSAVIRRIQAEPDTGLLGYTGLCRASIIKATLLRHQRESARKNHSQISTHSSNIDVMLNQENNNPAYLSGRLFAVIDSVQYKAYNAETIRERYLSSASKNPALVFPTLLRLSNHHAEKLTKRSDFVFYEKLKQSIIDKLTAESGFPKSLPLIEQGYFFLGYYQQKQDLFKGKADDEAEDNIEE